MPNIVSFKIHIEGTNEVKIVTFSAEELGKALDAVRGNTKTLREELVNLGAVSQTLENVAGALNQLNGMMEGLTKAYTEQIEAETLLATAMRNTMAATDEEIERIKKLTAEQQKLGIVGDEVQLAAAQELATYLTLSSSLETIIPVMNDMIAQQLRMGASAESATQIATMLGKVMNGQTKALSRYGYEFSEAQEYILQFGDESERAAVLIDVVGQSVGGANKNTRDAIGAWQDMINKLGDAEEALGNLTYKIQPAVTAMSRAGQAVIHFVQLRNAIKSVMDIQTVAAIRAKMYAAAQQLLARAGYSAAAGTMAMNAAVTALYATLTMGLSVAITGLITLFQRLGQKGKEAAEGIDKAREAQEAYANASMNMRLTLAEETVKLEALIKSKKDDTEAVRGLNSAYGQIFGNHKTAAEWYETLTAKSKLYTEQLGLEAQAAVLASQKEAKGEQLKGLMGEKNVLEQKMNSANAPAAYGAKYYWQSDDFKRDKARFDELGPVIEQTQGELDELTVKSDECTAALAKVYEAMGAAGTSGGKGGGGKSKAKDLATDLEDYRQGVERALQVHQAFDATGQDIDTRLSAMKSGITSLIGKYGAESESIRELIKEYKELRRTREQLRLMPDYQLQEMPGIIKTGQKDWLGRDITMSDRPTAVTPGISARPGGPTERDLAYRKYNEIKSQLPGADPSKLEILKQQMETLRELYDIPAEKADSLKASVDIFGALSDAMGNLSGLVGEGAASWLSWGANVMKAVGQALPALSALFSAQTAVAESGAAASVSGIPIAGPVMAVAAVASIAAAIGSFPHFADGAMIYGPTFGLMGEYANARSNPEFVGKVSEIKKYLPAGGGPIEVRVDISGRALKGVGRMVNRFDSRNNG